MSPNKKKYTLTLLTSISAFLVLFWSCSNQKNTVLTRTYHSINTRYNAHFNAEEAYKEALKTKEESTDDNLSEILNIYPDNSDTTQTSLSKGDFSRTIDKTTKAIKLHSIKAKPKKDPKKRNDANYQAWLQQKEFNPFLKNTWLLLAKGEFQSGDYIRSITTFMYISKIYASRPEIVSECKLWIARAYTEMGWMYEAANVLHKIDIAGGVPKKLDGLYASVYANYLVRNNEYEKAIPHLETAIKKEKSKYQKLRLKYLLGQIYDELGNKELAEKAYASVPGMNTPYKYSLNAKLRILEMVQPTDYEKAISSLNKMAKNTKNEEYQDQIYYTMGSIYMYKQDTIKALQNFNKAVEFSRRNGYDKALAQVTLGDIYFGQREYILAQPAYQGALDLLKKSNKYYPRVSLRSEVLDELVTHAKTLEEQDSLQYVAKLPEQERIKLIENIISELKKKEEGKKKEEERQQKTQERENNYTDWNSLGSGSLFESKTPQVTAPSTGISGTGESASFYFYSKQAVDQGKISFQKQWGNRKLEDDWRRRNKTVSTFDNDTKDDNELEESIPSDSIKTETDTAKIKPIEDIYSIDYYLQRLPFSEEEIRESNELIENALFNMGLIYKSKLEDLNLAIDAFETDLSRFPQTPNQEEIYYQLFLIYMQLNDHDKTLSYRNKLLNDHEDGKYATPLSDPNYEWNFRHFSSVQDSLYSATYNAYLRSDISTVRDNYHSLLSKYPFGNLMSKFIFLDALTYAQSHDAIQLRDNLKTLIEKYPKAEEVALATDILERIKDGKILLSDGSPISSIDWSNAFRGDSTIYADSINLSFVDDIDAEFAMLLRYKSNSIDRNELLYQVADYNFSNYVVHTFDLSFESNPPIETLQITGFDSFAMARSYLNKAFDTEGLIGKLDTAIMIIPISIENSKKLIQGQTIENYLSFFHEHYANQLPQLIAYWEQKRSSDYIAEKTDITPSIEDKSMIETLPDNDNNDNIYNIDQKEKEAALPIEQPKLNNEIESKEPENTITADDLLSQDQLQTIGKANDVLESAEDILSNPVDGLKGLFNKFKENKDLSKEEKEALKEEKELEKQRQKEAKIMLKAQQDSIRQVDKIRQDSIYQVEKLIQDSIKLVERRQQDEQKQIEQERKETIKAEARDKENARKQKEQERKERVLQQKERVKQREQERKEKLKEQDRIRREREKEQKDKRKNN